MEPGRSYKNQYFINQLEFTNIKKNNEKFILKNTCQLKFEYFKSEFLTLKFKFEFYLK